MNVLERKGNNPKGRTNRKDRVFVRCRKTVNLCQFDIRIAFDTIELATIYTVSSSY